MAKTTSTITLKVNDFSKGFDISRGENITSMDTAILCYNFDFHSGVLKPGIGLQEFKTPISPSSDDEQIPIEYDDFEYDIKSMYHYKFYSFTYNCYFDEIMFYASDNYIWYVVLNNDYPTTTRLSNLVFDKAPDMYTRKMIGLSCLIMANDTDNLGFWNGQGVPLRYETCPKVVSMCEHKNKIYFVTGGDQTFIRYTKNYHVTQWTEELNSSYGEGKIDLADGPDKINKLISFQGHLFAIRDYSILKITIYDDVRQTTWANAYISSSKIYAKTLQVCGDKMYVLTRDGVIMFDGVTATTLDMPFNSMFSKVDNKNAVACVHNGKYALACKLNYADNQSIGCETCPNHKNNTLLLIDTKTKDYSLTRGVDVADLMSLQCESLSKIILCFNTVNSGLFGEISDDGKIFATNSHKYWCSPLSDLGYSSKRKVVKEVSLISKYDCKLTIFTEKESKTFSVAGSEILNKFPVRLRGKQIGFKIETDEANAEISNLQMQIELVDTANAI